MGKMGQKERDRYNIARGGVAGMPNLIPASKKGVKAAPVAAAASAVAPTAAFTQQGALDPRWFMQEYARKDAEANAANERRYNEINQGYGNLIAATAQRYGDLNAGYDAQRQEFARLNNELNRGYDDRYKRNMAALEGAGLQEAADINEAAQGQSANVMQDLTNSGMAGTTVASTMKAGVERSRIAEQARLNERLRREKLQADMALSGDALNYKERGGNTATQLSNDQLRFRTGATEVNTGLNQAQLNFQERREDVGPDMGQYAQIAMALGQGGYGAPGTVGGAGGGAPASGGFPAAPYGGTPKAVGGPSGHVNLYRDFRAQAGNGTEQMKVGTRPLTPQETALMKVNPMYQPAGYVPGASGRGDMAVASRGVAAPVAVAKKRLPRPWMAY